MFMLDMLELFIVCGAVSDVRVGHVGAVYVVWSC